MPAKPSSDALFLPADPAALQRLVAEQQAVIESLRREKDEVARLLTEQIEKFKSQVAWLTKQLFGRKSEKIDPNQPWFDALTISAVEDNPPAAPVPATEQKVAAHTRKVTPHGRGELPANLPREYVVVDVSEASVSLGVNSDKIWRIASAIFAAWMSKRGAGCDEQIEPCECGGTIGGGTGTGGVGQTGRDAHR